MPLWATILTVVFSGIVAVTAITAVIRSTINHGINSIEKRFDRFESRLEKRFDSIDTELKNLNQRIDRHLERHP